MITIYTQWGPVHLTTKDTFKKLIQKVETQTNLVYIINHTGEYNINRMSTGNNDFTDAFKMADRMLTQSKLTIETLDDAFGEIMKKGSTVGEVYVFPIFGRWVMCSSASIVLFTSLKEYIHIPVIPSEMLILNLHPVSYTDLLDMFNTPDPDIKRNIEQYYSFIKSDL